VTGRSIVLTPAGLAIAGGTMAMEMTSSLNSRILVPLDDSAFSEEAIAVAMGAAVAGSVVTLCHVQTPATSVLDENGDARVSGQPSGAVPQWLQEVEGRMATRTGVRRESVVTAGDPAEQILAVARERGATMIVLASHGRGAALRLILGSVANEVVRDATIPVIVVRPGDASNRAGQHGFRRLVVPLDGSPLAATAIPVAATLAKSKRLPVLLVYAADLSQVESPLAGYGAALSDRVHQRVMGALKDQAQRVLEGAGAQLMRQGVVAAWRILLGPPAQVIADAVTAGDLIVIASHRRVGMERLLAGSTADELVATGAAPVMIIRETQMPLMTTPVRTGVEVASAV
jgi:nucleotide-binding universal stress UspA family protein